MTNKETAAHLRHWAAQAHGVFSWPTDGCGYEQHVRFVLHRNTHWHGGSPQAFRHFVLEYAAQLALEPDLEKE